MVTFINKLGNYQRTSELREGESLIKLDDKPLTKVIDEKGNLLVNKDDNYTNSSYMYEYKG